MYKHKFFESRTALLNWLNENNIFPEQIIAILPVPPFNQYYHQEYELFYREN